MILAVQAPNLKILLLKAQFNDLTAHHSLAPIMVNSSITEFTIYSLICLHFLHDYRLLKETVQLIFILSNFILVNWTEFCSQNFFNWISYFLKFLTFKQCTLQVSACGFRQIFLSFFNYLPLPAELFRNFISTPMYLTKALTKILKWTRTKITFLDIALSFTMMPL